MLSSDNAQPKNTTTIGPTQYHIKHHREGCGRDMAYFVFKEVV